ncbi:hypothetical protein Tco_1298285 [Tanacetum coccineum]
MILPFSPFLMMMKASSCGQCCESQGLRVTEGCQTDKGECEIASLSGEVKEHKTSLGRMLLESQKWAGYQVNLSTLESNVASLNAKKAKLEAVKASLCQDVEDLKRNRVEVVSKVLPYVDIELVYSDELGRLVGKLASASVFYGRCAAFEEVAKMKDPFDLSKVKGYRSSYKKEHTKAENDLATNTFPFISEFIVDPFAPIEVLPSKKPQSLQRPATTKNLALTPSKVTPATAPVS